MYVYGVLLFTAQGICLDEDFVVGATARVTKKDSCAFDPKNNITVSCFILTWGAFPVIKAEAPCKTSYSKLAQKLIDVQI